MNFLKEIKQSIYDRSYYKTLLTQPLRSSVAYFFMLIFLLSIIQTIVIGIPLYTEINHFFDQSVTSVITNYPADLRVQIHNGIASTNVQEPYFIAMPSTTQDNSRHYTHLLVIDTKTPFSQKQFATYNAAAWLTKDSLFYKQNTNQLRGADLSNIHDLIIDKSTLQMLSQKVSPWLHFVAPIVIVFVLIGIFIAYLCNFVYMFFLALILFLVAKLFTVKLSYGQAYKIGLHTITLGLLITIALQVAQPILHIHGFTFMTTLISIGVFVANFSKPSAKKRSK